MNRRSFFRESAAVGVTLATTTSALASSASSTASPRVTVASSADALDKALRPRPLSVSAGLEPFQPSAQNPWDESAVGHLLRRTTYLPRKADIQEFLALTTEQAVNKLLDFQPTDFPQTSTTFTPNAIPPWATEDVPGRGQITQDTLALWRTRMNHLTMWWAGRMLTLRPSILEKMTFFWSSHFTSEQLVVNVPQYMYQQNKLFRENALGNFQALTKKVVYDAAMLVYLNGNQNTKNKPNENFAREVMELFTLGEGHYTEQDIVQAAKSFTGWVTALTAPYYDMLVGNHDFTTKTFLGTQIKPTGLTKDAAMAESNTVIDAIFAHKFALNDAEVQAGKPAPPAPIFAGKNIAAYFLVKKLYKYFVYQFPDDTIVAQLADDLVANKFEIKPVLKKLLLSAHFFDVEFRGAKIKDPLEMSMGTMRQLGTVFSTVAVDATNPNPHYGYSSFAATSMGLQLLEPPNVAGWKGYHDWINTTTFPLRNSYSDGLLNGKMTNGRAFPAVDILAFARAFPSVDFIDDDGGKAFIRDVARFLLAIELHETTVTSLLSQFSPTYEWSGYLKNNPTAATAKLKIFFSSLMRLPEYQLV